MNVTALPKHVARGRSLPERRKLWLALNPGILSRITQDLGLKDAGHVSKVFNGKAYNAKVSAMLSELGAPGFEREGAA